MERPEVRLSLFAAVLLSVHSGAEVNDMFTYRVKLLMRACIWLPLRCHIQVLTHECLPACAAVQLRKVVRIASEVLGLLVVAVIRADTSSFVYPAGVLVVVCPSSCILASLGANG